MTTSSTSPTVYVCQASSCRNAGSRAVLLEIEELASKLGACTVRESGCLGACGRAPNAVIVTQGKESLCSRIRNVNVSASVVKKALGKAPDPDLINRLSDIRKIRVQCNYSLWSLEAVSQVSRHSAVYHFISKDSSRGTPNPPGRGRTVWAKTWHTTMLAQTGEKLEGTLPRIERDYTPVSSAKDWDNGKCDLLIKIYSQGIATSWLYNQPVGCNIWLSRPKKTLDVPSLVSDLSEATLKRPASVLLILGGTGIVTAAQVLQHRDPIKVGVAPALTVPVSLIYSCRQGDVLMTTDLVAWCKGRLDRCTLLMTESQPEVVPFPAAGAPVLDELQSLGNAKVLRERLTSELLAEELSALECPCRFVVSGPQSFNASVRQMLSEMSVDSDAITVLSA